MNQQNMPEFMLVIKGTHASWMQISADDKQRIMEKYISFVNRLRRENRFRGGSALKHDGIELRSEKGVVVLDGPFAETKEALNGYFLYQAANKDEAVAIARECPALLHGDRVEVFELSDH